VARSAAGRNAALYRVSSRSFPDRVAVDLGGRIAVVPRSGHEGDVQKNPYIAYNCLRIAGDWAVASNGSHTDPIAEKLELGVPPRDALAACLLALDYEKDQLSTPRIAALAPLAGDQGWLAIVRRDALIVREVSLEPGGACYVATYEHADVRPEQRVEFDAASAAQAARQVFDGPGFAQLERPVTSAAALAAGAGFELAIHSL
jgi:IMP cyclohydrolase